MSDKPATVAGKHFLKGFSLSSVHSSTLFKINVWLVLACVYMLQPLVKVMERILVKAQDVVKILL